MKQTWWKEGTVYQIYPRSFNDSNNDGIGDIRGIIDKLDYIKSLGVDIIWLCPVYDSPNDDNGYDIRDYYAIMDEFGTMEEMEQLLTLIHQKGMKLIMDLVVNHTSDEHAWFQESKSSNEHPKRDFYVWKDGKDGQVPNNWESFFSGSAWEKTEDTDQYYLHLFTKKQPDLNWENEQVRQEVYNMMNWWLDKGIDGFRMDVISLISKRNYEDSPHDTFNETIRHQYANGPRMTEFLEEINRSTFGNYDVMTVGEGPGITYDKALDYVQEDAPRLDMVFHFDHMFLDDGPGGKFDPTSIDFTAFKKIFEKWDGLVEKGGWPAIFLGNHDFPRIVSRFGNDSDYWQESAKTLITVLMTLRGTPYIFQGDEIGMTNVAFPAISDYRDVEIINAHKEQVGKTHSESSFLEAVHIKGRDNARTPLQWNATKNGGFTDTTPWINSNPNHMHINVASQESDPYSILNFYRSIISFRKKHKTLIYGSFDLVNKDHEALFTYSRWDDNAQFMVLANFSKELVEAPELRFIKSGSVVIKNYSDFDLNNATLRPWESVVVQIR